MFKKVLNVIKKKVKLSNLILLVVLLMFNSYAWFIYNTKVNTSISAKIEAWDIHEHRTKLVEQNAQRLGINIIETKVKDASLYDESLKEKFDKILLDVPCLGIGVIKRKPDIKWQRKPEDIEKITEIQKKILNNCSKYLKKDGAMVYSTCSILKEENENIIFEFLNKNSNFEIVKNGKCSIMPDIERDGFFICKLHKK